MELDGVRVAVVHDSGPSAGRSGRLRRWFPTPRSSCSATRTCRGTRPTRPASATSTRGHPPNGAGRADPTCGLLDLHAGRVQGYQLVDLGRGRGPLGRRRRGAVSAGGDVERSPPRAGTSTSIAQTPVAGSWGPGDSWTDGCSLGPARDGDRLARALHHEPAPARSPTPPRGTPAVTNLVVSPITASPDASTGASTR